MKQYTIIKAATIHAYHPHGFIALFLPLPVTIQVNSNNDIKTGIIDNKNIAITDERRVLKGISVFVNNIAIQITNIAENIAIAEYLDCLTPIK